MNDFLKAIILGIVEGITEFLPVSSTGHLILMNQWIGFTEPFEKMFDIVIQLGAILAVVVYFHKRIFPWKNMQQEEKKKCYSLWQKTFIAVLPAMAVGFVFHKTIKTYLFHPFPVAIALLVGAFFLIALELKPKKARIETVEDLGYQTAFWIGIIQCLAMIPGTSRSAATIIGAMLLGTSRLVATEFSFFLAIPTMMAASGYSLLKTGVYMSQHEFLVLATGFSVAFLIAYLVIAAFLKFISKNNFIPFALYRLILGILILALMGTSQ
ncbi:MAG: undecaprenyl-diphosphate phosphatase [Candidatus Brocadiae bacterium]|nr:undecaprenyl-diphosphate phosphatase [Candidatus Brocadiia bacterium]